MVTTMSFASQRAILFQRDNKTCRWCQRQLPFDEATRDHVVPLSQNGSNSLLNQVLACKKCNNRRGNKSAEEFAKECGVEPPPVDLAMITDAYWTVDEIIHERVRKKKISRKQPSGAGKGVVRLRREDDDSFGRKVIWP